MNQYTDYFIFNHKNYNSESNYIKPSVFCNNSKLNQQNNDIYVRNIPDKKMEILPDYRSNVDICVKNINPNFVNHNKNYGNKILEFDFIKSSLEPGKGIGTDFLTKIDIDSELKIHEISKCQSAWWPRCHNFQPFQPP